MTRTDGQLTATQRKAAFDFLVRCESAADAVGEAYCQTEDLGRLLGMNVDRLLAKLDKLATLIEDEGDRAARLLDAHERWTNSRG